MKRNALRIVSAALACIIICMGLVSCSDPLKSTDKEKEIVMTVGDYEVPYELYRYLVLNYKTEVTKNEDDWKNSEKAALMTEQIEAKAEESLRNFYAVIKLSEENGVYTDNETVKAAVDAAIKATRNGYESDEDYAADLAKGYMNHSVYTLMQTNSVCSEELYYAMINNGRINADEKKLEEAVYGDEFIRIKQILVVGESHSKVSDGTVYVPEEKHTDEEAEKLANEALKKAQAGEDFDSLVADYGESFYMFSNEDGYYICRGIWEKVNEDAVFALEVGEVSEVVESDAGFSVFKRFEKDEAYLEKNYDELCESYKRAQYSLMVEDAAEQFEIKKTEEGKALSVKDIKWEEEEK